MAPFPMTLSDSYPKFQGRDILQRQTANGTRQSHILTIAEWQIIKKSYR